MNRISPEILREAITIIKEERKSSISFLQRRLQLTYNEAAEILKALEDLNYIGPYNSLIPREIYI